MNFQVRQCFKVFFMSNFSSQIVCHFFEAISDFLDMNNTLRIKQNPCTIKYFEAGFTTKQQIC